MRSCGVSHGYHWGVTGVCVCVCVCVCVRARARACVSEQESDFKMEHSANAKHRITQANTTVMHRVEWITKLGEQFFTMELFVALFTIKLSYFEFLQMYFPTKLLLNVPKYFAPRWASLCLTADFTVCAHFPADIHVREAKQLPDTLTLRISLFFGTRINVEFWQWAEN